jgi:hypothetical protein
LSNGINVPLQCLGQLIFLFAASNERIQRAWRTIAPFQNGFGILQREDKIVRIFNGIAVKPFLGFGIQRVEYYPIAISLHLDDRQKPISVFL